MLTLALALGTRLPAMAAGAITVVLFGLGWFVGVLGNVAVAFDAPALQRATEAFRFLLPTDGLWRGVIYGLEPPLVLLMSVGRTAEANPFFAPDAAARGVHGLERRVGAARAGRPASPCSGAASSSPRGSEPQEPGERLRVEQVRLEGERAGRPPGVVDRPEHVRGDRLRAGGPVQRDAVQPPRDPAPRQVQLRQVADVRPRVALEHRAQLRAGEAARRPRPARRARVPGRAVRATVGDAPQVRDRGPDGAARRHEHVLVVLGRAAAGREEERVDDRAVDRDHLAREAADDRARRCSARPRRRGRPATACRRRRRSCPRPGGAAGRRTSGPPRSARGGPPPASRATSRPGRRRGGRGPARRG